MKSSRAEVDSELANNITSQYVNKWPTNDLRRAKEHALLRNTVNSIFAHHLYGHVTEEV